MGWDISIVDDDDNRLEASTLHGVAGGTYQIGGTRELWYSLTYNYSQILSEALGFPLDELNGKVVFDTVPVIAQAYASLEDDDERDYWKATNGNVKRALFNLGIMAFHAQYRGKWSIK